MERVTGPHANRSRISGSICSWRVVYTNPTCPDPKLRRRHFTFEDTPAGRQAAERCARELRKAIHKGPLTIEHLIHSFEEHLRQQGLKRARERARLLELFFETKLSTQLRYLTQSQAERLYELYAEGKRPATHRGALSQAKTFVKWACKRGHCSRNVMVDIEGFGRVNRGKPQLRHTEAQAIWRYCLAVPLVNEIDPIHHCSELQRATATILAFVVGLRAGEIIGIRGRDVDDDGHFLWVCPDGDGKSRKATRNHEIPPVIALRLQALARTVDPNARLFPFGRQWPRHATRWIARAAGVLGAGSPEQQGLACTAQAFRALKSSLATSAGATAQMVADSLGHESPAVTERNYIRPGAISGAQSRRLVGLLEGTMSDSGIPADLSDQKAA